MKGADCFLFGLLVVAAVWEVVAAAGAGGEEGLKENVGLGGWDVREFRKNGGSDGRSDLIGEVMRKDVDAKIGEVSVKNRNGGSSFRELTTMAETSDVGVGSVISPFGEEFFVSYNVTYNTRDGIVSLGGASHLLKKVQCFEDGSIRIQMIPTFSDNGEALDDMYPIGSLLVVNSELFGGCNLKKLHNSSQAHASGFLRVESVSGDVYDHVVRGGQTHFFALFSSSNIDVQRTGRRRMPVGDSRSNGAPHPVNFLTTLENDQENAKFNAAFTSKNDVIKLEAAGNIKARNNLERVKIVGEGESFSVLYLLTMDMDLESSLTMSVTPGAFKSEVPESLGSTIIPVHDIHIPLPLHGEEGKGSLGLPALRLELFLELVLKLNGETDLKKPWQLPTKVSYSTGRKKFVIKANARQSAQLVGDIELAGLTAATDPEWEFQDKIGQPLVAPSNANIESTKQGSQLEINFGLSSKIVARLMNIETEIEFETSFLTSGMFVDKDSNPLLPRSKDYLLGKSAECDGCYRSLVEIGGYVGKYNTRIQCTALDLKWEVGLDFGKDDFYGLIKAYCFSADTCPM